MICYEKHPLFPPEDNLAPVIFIHGFMGTPAMWDGVYGHMRINRFEDGVYTATLPGHGTDPGAIQLDLGRSIRFDAAVDAALDRLPVSRCSVVAYSMGARLALAMILKKPEAFRSAVLVGCSPGISDLEERLERKSWDEAQAAAIERDGMDRFVDHWETLPLFASQAELPGEVLAAQRRMRISNSPQGVAFAMRNLGLGNMPALWELLPHLKVSTRVVTGRRDEKFGRIAGQMKRLSDRIEHLVIDNAGHNVVLEQPEAFAASFEEFI